MLINNILYTILSIAIPIILWIGLSVFIKRKWNSYYGILIGMIVSPFAFGAFQAFGKIYIVDKELNVGCYRLIGTLEYDFNDSKKSTIMLSRGETGIINDSEEELIIEP